MLSQRLRRLTNITAALVQRILFSGQCLTGGAYCVFIAAHLRKELLSFLHNKIFNIFKIRNNVTETVLSSFKRSQQAQYVGLYVEPMLVHRLRRWSNIGSTWGKRFVFDVGPTLKQHWFNVSCLLRYLFIHSHHVLAHY